MSLDELKISAADIAAKGVCAAPDKLSGTAQENKALFDRLIRECLAEKFNELIERLGGMEAGKGVQSDTVRYIRVVEGGILEISPDGDSWTVISGGGGAYTLPAATADTLGGVKVGEGLSIDAEGVLSAPGAGALPDGDGVSY